MTRGKTILGLLTSAALFGCGQSDCEKEVESLRAQLSNQAMALRTARSQATEERALRVKDQARLQELEARGTPIVNFRLTVTIRCKAVSSQAFSNLTGSVTTVRLLTRDNASWQLASSHKVAPVLADAGEGSSDISFDFEPAGGSTLLGADLEKLAGVIALETKFGPLLSSLGCEVGPEGVTRLVVSVNNVRVIDQSHLGMPDTSSGYPRLDVTNLFAQITAAYRAKPRNGAS